MVVAHRHSEDLVIQGYSAVDMISVTWNGGAQRRG